MRGVAVAAGALALFAGAALAQEEKKNDLSVTDFSAGAVSAGTLVGLEKTAITEVQSSQDLVVALKPLSSGQSKTGFGIAVSPFRTTIMPMAGSDYAKKGWEGTKNRLLGALTLSYAENAATIASTSYRKSGFSADTSLYLNDENDPVIRGNRAFGACKARREAQDKMKEALEKGDTATAEKLEGEAAKAAKDCIDKANDPNKAPWNADRIALSFGGGWIKPDNGMGAKESLGRSLTLGGLFAAGKQGALQLSYRRTTHEVDLTTLGGSPGYKGSKLAAARFTYGSEENGETKVLAEVSNANTSEVTVSNGVYKYAIGLDKKVAKGVWLQFRLGKNRTLGGTSTETTSLLTLNFAPTASLFAK
jgi:hypothetical protein